MQSNIARKRFTVDDYHKMLDIGILEHTDRVQLIDGEVLQMTPMGGPHAAAVARATKLFTVSLRDDALVRIQLPLILGGWSEPEPDVSVVRPRADFYVNRHPGAEDVLFLMEISDTTLDFDRDVKSSVYAGAGIGEIWILDLTACRLHVFRDPSRSGYRITKVLGPSEWVAPGAFPGHRFEVSALIP